MKITFVIPTPNLAGGIRVVAIYAKHLKKLGHEVLVVSTPKRPPGLRQQVHSLLRAKGWISLAAKGVSHFDNIDVPLKVIERHRPIIDSDVPDADVVVATWWETAKWVANLSEAKGAKVYFIQGYAAKFEYLLKEQVEATYALQMHKITISKQLVDWHKSRYGNGNISLVPNSIDTKQFNVPPRSKQVIPTVGMMYSTIYWKGCDVSLKAFFLAIEKIPNLRLIAFGSEKPTRDLPLPPGTNYVCQPKQNIIKDIYAKCDVWLFGSSSLEGFGLPILEAMTCRTPVIATAAGAAPELLANGGGILIKDAEDMAKAIERVCNFGDSEWRTMSDAAYATATQYTWDDATQLFEQALFTAIERWKRRELSHSDKPKMQKT
ncbi:MAG: glycosyltransferase family 1 protein [Gammaproteobacteria bacterium]|nr:MAG: glycosyltransferase family 1 protein [Gammaproteobacteria bacterium]RKZ77437.1 MAG: glycosyltransferase family 1 protein [Gammaproteobacteria bacterium]